MSLIRCYTQKSNAIYSNMIFGLIKEFRTTHSLSWTPQICLPSNAIGTKWYSQHQCWRRNIAELQNKTFLCPAKFWRPSSLKQRRRQTVVLLQFFRFGYRWKATAVVQATFRNGQRYFSHSFLSQETFLTFQDVFAMLKTCKVRVHLSFWSSCLTHLMPFTFWGVARPAQIMSFSSSRP